MDSNFSETQKKRISKKLGKNLSPDYLSVRSGFGNTQLTYVEGWLIISLANKIFGFDGWSSEMKSFTEEYLDNIDGRISVGYSCCVRVTLKNGIYKEDVGFGSSEGQKTKGQAIEKAKKEAATDGLKRALRQFGNALGNCCYNKDFLRCVHKIKKQKKADFDGKNLLKIEDLDESIDDLISFEHSHFDLNDSIADKKNMSE